MLEDPDDRTRIRRASDRFAQYVEERSGLFAEEEDKEGQQGISKPGVTASAEREALKDFFAQGSNSVEYNLFLKAQQAWSGKSRVMEAELMSWDCNLCSQCRNVSIGVSAEHDKCEYCCVIEIGKRKRKGHKRYSNESDSEAGSADENIIPEDYVGMYSAENKAIPPARRPEYAALDLVEQAFFSPIIPSGI